CGRPSLTVGQTFCRRFFCAMLAGGFNPLGKRGILANGQTFCALGKRGILANGQTFCGFRQWDRPFAGGFNPRRKRWILIPISGQTFLCDAGRRQSDRPFLRRLNPRIRQSDRPSACGRPSLTVGQTFCRRFFCAMLAGGFNPLGKRGILANGQTFCARPADSWTDLLPEVLLCDACRRLQPARKTRDPRKWTDLLCAAR
ncbi:MAG: hypothetical protein RLZZ179_1992, partial [Verrucomicrobiota bacterium]